MNLEKSEEVIRLMNEKYDYEDLNKKDYQKIKKLQGIRIVRGKQIGLIERKVRSLLGR